MILIEEDQRHNVIERNTQFFSRYIVLIKILSSNFIVSYVSKSINEFG